MAVGAKGRTLEETPTWAVAGFCFLLVSVSIIIEHCIHLLGKWLTKKHKRALYEALEKIKSELMLLGFMSLLLTVGQGHISKICVTKSVGSSWHPCKKKLEINKSIHDFKNYYYHVYFDHENNNNNNNSIGHRRRFLLSKLLSDPIYVDTFRRILAFKSNADDQCASQGKVSLLSAYGIHQLHIFIFILAVFHVLYCIITLALGRTKINKWKLWEMETRTIDYQFTNDPERFRFTRDTTFGRRHLNFWTNYPFFLWIVCFFRQFFVSVPKVDYMTLRNGFIIAHLAPQGHSRFDFQKYINRSLEQDFKVVVGISPIIWFFAILFLLSNTNGWRSYLWLPFLPLIMILLIGTKLQVIIAKMGLQIQERGDVVRGTPLVQPGDDLFWFSRPRLVLHLIHFILFQNAFQLAFLVWTFFEFGMKSCFHDQLEDVIIRISMGVLIQILCGYVTLPLYALVTQMGSTMKPAIFNHRIANALRRWHRSARKQVRLNRRAAGAGTGTISPGTPSGSTSPVHILHRYRNELDGTLNRQAAGAGTGTISPGTPSGSTSPAHILHRYRNELDGTLMTPRSPNNTSPRHEEAGEGSSSRPRLSGSSPSALRIEHHEIDIIPNKDFSFDKM